MKKEYKNLILKDLCARLPYHVRVKVWLKDGTTEEGPLDLQHNYGDVLRGAFYYNEIVDIKPYLRSMKDMTKDEAKEMLTLFYPKSDLIKVEIVEDWVRCYVIGNGWTVIFFNRIYTTEQMDWLLEKHFDFRGLIDLDLAIRVTEENNPYKN